MTTAILITQCLQADFVGPLQPHEPIPNSLHVGRNESQRLLGVDPEIGPLAQVFRWAWAQETDKLAIVHVRDWHNPDDPLQQQHLKHFGLHCIEGTPGAELVINQAAAGQRPNEYYINSLTLNDFEGGTGLCQLLDELTAHTEIDRVRVGVIGVWTEAKVTFLLYELMTRCRLAHLATCSALTASASRAQHLNAIDQLRKILGIQVFDSIGEFTSWLSPDGAALTLPKLERGMSPRVEVRGQAALAGIDLEVLSYLYRDSSFVELQPLSGGFSGAGVYRVSSRDALGHWQAASVLKLGPRELIAKERVAFERIESILGNDAPSIRGTVDLEDVAGIKFAYAAMGTAGVTTLKTLYETGAAQERIDAILQRVFTDILGRFQAGAQYENLPLLDYYTFDAKYAASIRQQVASLVGDAAAQARLTLPGGYDVANVADFYEHELAELPRHPSEFHFVSYVHGDLNTANILVDDRENVWLIDFLHAHRGHALRDVAKLENDLLYILTKLQCEEDLIEALRITSALRCVKDLRAPLPEHLNGVSKPDLLRAWQTLRTLRGIGAEVCREERDPLHLSIALMRYAVHTLWFPESNEWQKLWALAAAGGYAEDLIRTTRDNRRLRVDWLPASLTSAMGGRVGLTICPGRLDRSRNLSADLSQIFADGAKRLVTLLTRDEMEWAGATNLSETAAQHGLVVRFDPIPDQDVPSIEQMNALYEWIEDGLKRNEDCVLHCLGGLGRSGTVAACLLVRQGLAPDAAIRAVRDARGPRAVENSCQEQFIHEYAMHHRL